MASNGDRYKPLQTHPSDYAKFVKKCKKLGVHQVDGFKLAVESWEVDITDEDKEAFP